MKQGTVLALEKKKKVVESLKAARPFFESAELTRSSGKKRAGELAKEVEGSIDRLEIRKDSMAYTFGFAMNDAIDRYFNAEKKNPKEEARFARQSAKREALIARGKTVDWKVVPKLVYDLDELKANITGTIDAMVAHYEDYIAKADTVAFSARSVELQCGADVLLEDNFFDMNGGERRVRILRGKPTGVSARSVYDIK